MFTVGTAVAKTIGSGMIDVGAVDPNVILGGLLGAITWNVITWYYGIPSSSSHALIGGYAGAAIAKAGWAAIAWGRKWIETLSFIVISPLVGLLVGFTLMVRCIGYSVRCIQGGSRSVPWNAAVQFGAVLRGTRRERCTKDHGDHRRAARCGRSLTATQTGIWHHLYIANANTFHCGSRSPPIARSRWVLCSAGGASWRRWVRASPSCVRSEASLRKLAVRSPF